MIVIGLTTTYRREELSQADLIIPSLEAVRVAAAEPSEGLVLSIDAMGADGRLSQ